MKKRDKNSTQMHRAVYVLEQGEIRPPIWGRWTLTGKKRQRVFTKFVSVNKHCSVSVNKHCSVSVNKQCGTSIAQKCTWIDAKVRINSTCFLLILLKNCIAFEHCHNYLNIRGDTIPKSKIVCEAKN